MKYFICEGCSVTSLKGVLGPHDEVTAKVLGHPNEDGLVSLEKANCIYKAKMNKLDAAKAKESGKAKKDKAVAEVDKEDAKSESTE